MRLTEYCTILLICVISFSTVSGQEEPVINPQFANEIKSLAANQKVKMAFDLIYDSDERTIAEMIHLTEIGAPPFKEGPRANAFAEMLRNSGAQEVWIDEVGNVLARRRGTKGDRTVALDAHLDTVFPEETDVTVRIVNDTMYAPGIGDDTRGLSMLPALFRAMEEANIRTDADILFIGSVGEEGLGDLRGVKHLFSDAGPQIDSWIAIDGGQIGRVNNKGLGSYRYKVIFKGPGGHSWGAFGLANPHHALGTATDAFVKMADEFTSYGPRTSYNIGRIGGGTSINSVPFESWMEVDIRSVSPSRLDTMESFLYKAVDLGVKDQNQRKRLGASMSADIEKIGDRPSGELSSELPIVQRAMAGTAYFGKRPRLTRGSTNSNIPISLGIPAVTIGRGGLGANGHSLDEWWYNKEGHKAIQLALLLVVAEARLSD